MNPRIAVLATVLCSIGAPNARTAAPAAYPSKSIRIIVPTVPGVPPDAVARILGERLNSVLGQMVVVENRPGAIGTIGLQALTRATPDGYTLGILTMPNIAAPALLPQVRYDTERDLAPVTLVCWNYNILTVPANSSVQTIAHLITSATARPGSISFASAGNGTPGHLAGELIKREWRVNLTHLPYKGGAAAATAVTMGEANMYVGSVTSLASFISAGRLRALATIAPRRLAAYPELPTLIELGYPKLELTDWQAVVAPAATPSALVTRLHAEIAKQLEATEVRQRFDALGMPVAGWGPAQFAPYLHSEIRRWRAFIGVAGVKAD